MYNKFKTLIHLTVIITLFLGFAISNSYAASLSDFYTTGDTNSCPHVIAAFNCTPDFIVNSSIGTCKTMAEMTSLETICINETTHSTQNRDLRCDTQCCWPASTGLAAACATQNRSFTVCGNPAGTCGACLTGFIEIGGTCIAEAFTDGTKIYDKSGTEVTITGGLWDGTKPGNIYYNDGNVGIGTDAPLGKFHTQASLNSSADTQYGIISNVISSGSGITIGVRGGVSGTSNEKVGVYGRADRSDGTTAYGVYGIASGTGGTAWSGYFEGANVYMGLNVGIGTTTIGSKLQVDGNAAIGYSASTVAPTNGLVVSGNVGIGTTSPSALLHVNGTPVVTYRNFHISGSGSWNPGITIQKTGGDIFAIYASETGLGFQRRDSAGLNPIEAMRINSAGNVGIGTTSPADVLEVKNPAGNDKGVLISSNTDGDSPTLSLQSTQATHKITSYESHGHSVGLKIQAGATAISDGGREIHFYTGNNVAMHIASGGEVGIGTSGYSQKLAVGGDSIFMGITSVSGATGLFRTYTDAYLAVSSGTRVGIGTISPNYKLDVSGNMRINTSVYDSDSYAARFMVAGATRFGLKSNGGVVIGTNTTPPERGLYVYGDASVGSLTNRSSIKFKNSIQPLSEDANVYDILKLEPKTFKYNDFNEVHLGYIAEDVEKTGLKYLVSYNENGSIEGLHYDKIPVYLLEVIKGQQKTIDDLKSRIELLESK